MLNDREDKYESPEESEYHFSDDDISYETDSESPKTVVVPEQKEPFYKRLSRSRRMMIVGVVFLVLVYVVYKMVSPATISPPTTEITPIATTTITPPVIKSGAETMRSANENNVAPEVITQQPSQPAVTVTATAQSPSGATQTTTTVTTNQQPALLPGQQTVAPVAQAPNAAPSAPLNTNTPDQLLQQQAALGGALNPSTANPTVQQPQTEAQMPSQPIVAAQIPSQIPVSQITAASNQQVPTQTAQTPTTPANNVDAGLATMAATNEKLMAQLQAEYAQKLNDFTAQNKAIQDQVQTLNTRVASMESQMNQLIQALNRQMQNTQAAPAPMMVAPPPQAVPATPAAEPQRIGYTVQAIIPGRAWLRSDNGETVTVAEGDVIKDVGRVSKIDPYDGVVEINTGSRTVSLSYGAGS